ncbi:hypothetical protein LIER_36702 [Lithospermum erythrorhizon]|uniref:Uncharacterized protein n=1 Tax=Lithospermum erythrorhizon TaxID=34254 RepID=A0AAV3P9P7_LITER
MKQLQNIDKKAHLWQLKHANSPTRWCNTFFPLTVKSDMLCNNLSESFNSFILEGSDKPIITMLETIRRKLMERIRDRKVAMERKSGIIYHRIVKILDDNFTLSDGMKIEWNGGTILRSGHMVTSSFKHMIMFYIPQLECHFGIKQMKCLLSSPECVKQADRSKKLKRKGIGEVIKKMEKYVLSKKGDGICGGTNHNKRSCL